MENVKRGFAKKTAGMILLLLLMLLAAFPVSAAGTTVKVSVKGKLDYEKAYQALTYTNQIRAKAGASALKMDKDLMNVAMQRAAAYTATSRIFTDFWSWRREKAFLRFTFTASLTDETLRRNPERAMWSS